MTSNYTRRTPIDDSQAPCHPTQRMDACYLCTRWRIAPEAPVDQRQFVVIDASIFASNGACPMYEARPVSQPYSEPTIAEAA